MSMLGIEYGGEIAGKGGDLPERRGCRSTLHRFRPTSGAERTRVAKLSAHDRGRARPLNESGPTKRIGAGIDGVQPLFRDYPHIGFSAVSPKSTPTSGQGRSGCATGFRLLQMALARDYPAELVALIDRDRHCVARVEQAPDGCSLMKLASDGSKLTIA